MTFSFPSLEMRFPSLSQIWGLLQELGPSGCLQIPRPGPATIKSPEPAWVTEKTLLLRLHPLHPPQLSLSLPAWEGSGPPPPIPLNPEL